MFWLKMGFLLKNGNVFLNGGFIKAGLVIENGKISGIIFNGPDNEYKAAACRKKNKIIDCSNKYVLPGLIDIHVHFRDFGQEYKEDWFSGSRAAIAGGITTVFDMPNNLDPVTTLYKLRKKQEIAEKKSLINFGLYIAATDKNIDEINKSGLTYVKLYYGPTTGKIQPGNIEKIFHSLNKNILIVAHAEEKSIIRQNKKKFLSRALNKNFGRDISNYPNIHSLIRDNSSEYAAVNFLIGLAAKYKNRLHITHVSTKESMKIIENAKKSGLRITCDTCPHYLLLDDSAYSKLGNLAKVNPSLKSNQDREALWLHLNKGNIDCICSDHAPHLLKEKASPYNNCPSGFPGVETSLQLMLTEINKGRLTLSKLAGLMSANPAKIFNIKNKGAIKKGYDADLTIIDMDKEDIIKKESLFTKSGWSPFEETATKGKCVMAFVKGKAYKIEKGRIKEILA